MKVKCAVIGLGRIGVGFDDNQNKIIRTHVQAYKNHKNCELISLCDIDENKLKKYGKKFRISELYTSYSELFKNEKIDCVSICTFADTHKKIVKKAAEFGVKRIFLEKPMASTLDDAKEIINICKKNKITLSIDHQRRFHSNYPEIKKNIENKLGKIYFINITYGSGIGNTGTHIFDMLRYFFGEVYSIQSSKSSIKSNNPKDPNIDVSLTFVNKIKCKMNVLDWNNYAELKMDIFGKNGMISLNMLNNIGEYYTNIKKNTESYQTLKLSKTINKKSKLSPIQIGLNDLLLSTKNNCKTLSEPNDGYHALELIIASMMSLNNNKIITLPIKKSKINISVR